MPQTVLVADDDRAIRESPARFSVGAQRLLPGPGSCLTDTTPDPSGPGGT
ncbi:MULTISPECIES: hypothetical protein [Pseudonocardia]